MVHGGGVWKCVVCRIMRGIFSRLRRVYTVGDFGSFSVPSPCCLDRCSSRTGVSLMPAGFELGPDFWYVVGRDVRAASEVKWMNESSGFTGFSNWYNVVRN